MESGSAGEHELVSKEDVAAELGSEWCFIQVEGEERTYADVNLGYSLVLDEWRDHFFFRTEEYLHSLISLLNELVSRHSLRPIQLSCNLIDFLFSTSPVLR